MGLQSLVILQQGLRSALHRLQLPLQSSPAMQPLGHVWRLAPQSRLDPLPK
jgi:hypothetical protein